MRLVVNGEEKEFDPQIKTLKDLVSLYNLKTPYYAVMLNSNIIKKNTLDQSILKEGDKIDIVHMVGGG